MNAMRLRTCPRCGDPGYEVLDTHAYCVACNYASEFAATGFYIELPDAALAAMSTHSKLTQQGEL